MSEDAHGMEYYYGEGDYEAEYAAKVLDFNGVGPLEEPNEIDLETQVCIVMDPRDARRLYLDLAYLAEIAEDTEEGKSAIRLMNALTLELLRVSLNQ